MRTQTLTPSGPGRCRYESAEAFSGPLTGLTQALYGPTVAAGVQAMGEALRDRAEARVSRVSAATSGIPSDWTDHRLPHRPGWYAALPGRELGPGQAKAVQICGEELVVWRTRGGRLGAARNICSHLLSRLAPQARVEGEHLVCAHHGAHFTANGTSCEGHRSLDKVHARDAGPVVMVWHDPAGHGPRYELPDIGDPSFGAYTWRSFDLPVHPQHVMQDLADVDHFLSVHGYRSARVLKPTRADGHVLSFSAEVGWDPGLTALPSIPVRFTSAAHGVGFQVTDVRAPGGLALSRHLVLPSPIDTHTTRLWLGLATRLSPRLQARLGPASLLAERSLQAIVGLAFRRDVLRDASLWTARLHLPQAPTSEAHATFDRWLDHLVSGPRTAVRQCA